MCFSYSANRNRAVKTLVNKIKSAAAKVIVPVALKPSSQFIIRMSLKKVFEPISQELIEGENKVMNQRLLDLIHEADRKGILDALCA